MEATNFAVISSIMNIWLAITDYLSWTLYEWLKIPWTPETIIDLHAVNILITIWIFTSLSCLIVLPFLKIEKFVKEG
jgi:hypothetical protein